MLQDIRGGTFWVSAPAIYSASSYPSPSSHATEIASGDALTRATRSAASGLRSQQIEKKGAAPKGRSPPSKINP